MQRSVYHKYVEVEVEVPYTFTSDSELQEYLQKNEHLYIDNIDEAISEANLQYGSGVEEYRGMCELEADSEWRYELDNGNGGHL
ncbi:MAG: hypothetical protein CMI60_00925 [Parvibaculum sp.]|nr:hypothetical protein [Parvibaculum sp.]